MSEKKKKPHKRGDPTKTETGKWTFRVYVGKDANGKKQYKRITKDTKDECIMAALQLKSTTKKKVKGNGPGDLTIGQAVDKYIRVRGPVLSITTVQGYDKIRRTAFDSIWDTKVIDFNDEIAQLAINDESVRIGRRGQISPKTVANNWGLISSALKTCCNRTYNIRLPKGKRNIKEFPEPEVVLQAIKGTSIELPCMLAFWLTLSMSEIRGLKYSDISNGSITINRVMVDAFNKPTIQDKGKTKARIRRLRIPDRIQALIDASDHSSEFVVPLNANQIDGRFATICKKNNLDLTFHGLRHVSTSIMEMLRIPYKYQMERGGWSSTKVMTNVYQHTFSQGRIDADNKIDNYINGVLDQLSIEI